MLPTIVNAVAVVLGGIIGFFFKSKIKQSISQSILKVVGVVVLIFGIVGAVSAMTTIDEGKISIRYELLLLITLTLGTLIGELLKIDTHLTRFGDYIESKLNKSKVSEAFITSSLIFCVGAMAIVGSVNAALGDYQILYLKSMIDGITALILASTLGLGVVLSAVSILIYQGSITLLASIFGSFMHQDFINSFSMVGYVMVAVIGLNFIREEKIKVANMLPALLLIILYYIFTSFF